MRQSLEKHKKRKRVFHSIRRLKNIRLPSRYIFFDTETKTIDDRGTQKMILAVGVFWCTGKDGYNQSTRWFSTKKTKELASWIFSFIQSGRPLRVMSANIWFDLRISGLLNYLESYGMTCTYFFTKGHTFISIFEKDKCKIEFINIQNYFNIPVTIIGKSIGVKKLEVDFKTVSMKDLKVYCKRDVEIIFKAFKSLYNLLSDNDLGSLGYTIPSVAMSCYLHSFYPRTIYIHDKKQVLELERQAYYGGRCECFKIGRYENDIYYKLDVNSMYPYVMSRYEYPVRYVKHGTRFKPKILDRLRDTYCMVAKVTIETDQPIYPVRQGNKIIFPIGEFITYLTTPSLLYAYDNDHLKYIHRLVLYTKGNIFQDYVTYMYQKRLEYRKKGNPAFAYICKILMNSLYGKFGQWKSEEIWRKEKVKGKSFRELIYHVQEKKSYIHQRFYGLEQMICENADESINSSPAICAHVTDYARMYLWSLIEKVGFKHLFYVDTDSLIVDSVGRIKIKSLLNPDILGSLKIEDKANNIEIIGAKLYQFGKVIKRKGVKLDAKEVKDNTFEMTHFPTAISELREGNLDAYKIGKTTKTLTMKYDKGEVKKDGTVSPLVLSLKG